MALTLGDNFSYQGAKPLDARLTYSTLAAMKAVADATMYEGCLAYCTATGKTYQWKSTNTVDETLGKWREFESGGSGGTSDYNDLDNLPKINNVEVKGNLTTEDLGIDIPTKTSELTNDSGFITEEDLPETDGAIDLSKFKAPGTAGQVDGHIYSTDETVVGKWIDGKPLYEKVINETFPVITIDEKVTSKNVDVSALNIDKVISIGGVGTTGFSLNRCWGEGGKYYNMVGYTGSDLLLQANRQSDGLSAIIILQYTKTTDTV